MKKFLGLLPLLGLTFYIFSSDIVHADFIDNQGNLVREFHESEIEFYE